MRKTILAFSLVAVLLLVGVFSYRSQVIAADALINSELLAQLEAGSADFFIKMADDVDSSDAVAINEREARLWYVYDTMSAHAAADQADIQALLDRQGVEYVSFWINNSIFVRNGDLALARALADRADVAYLRPNRSVPLIEPVAIGAIDDGNDVAALEWGVERVNANDVWAMGYDGTGIVVANIDTGARYTHEALIGNYRGNDGNHDYDWWDPDLVYSVPTDNNGHGTHTIGTMVGDDGGANQIGVAPGAKWIAAQGCDTNSCSDFDLTSSAQWIACPTQVDGNNPNCSLAPHVVNNSWGGPGGDPWYESYVQAWINAGIGPIFSAGNSGWSCGSVGSPGDNRLTMGVAATDVNDKLATFSSRGPGTLHNRTQPDISAPGVNVRSAYNTSDTAYASLSGTSMAAPHVAGVGALVLDKNPNLPLPQYFVKIVNGARETGLQNPGLGAFCGDTPWHTFSPANNMYGHGLVDALKTINNVPAP